MSGIWMMAGGVARKCKAPQMMVSGAAKKVKKGDIIIGGAARRFYSMVIEAANITCDRYITYTLDKTGLTVDGYVGSIGGYWNMVIAIPDGVTFQTVEATIQTFNLKAVKTKVIRCGIAMCSSLTGTGILCSPSYVSEDHTETVSKSMDAPATAYSIRVSLGTNADQSWYGRGIITSIKLDGDEILY